MTADEIDVFWTAARHQTRTNPVPGYLGTYSGEALAPPAWAFGGWNVSGCSTRAEAVDLPPHSAGCGG